MRLFRHLFPPSVRRLFPADSLQRIADAIHQAEQRHTGEVMFAVESDLPILAVLRGVPPATRAQEAFARLRTWDTEANNGVLIYLLLADHHLEIVADRGLRGRVSDAQWRGVCQLMEEHLRAGEAEHAVIRGINAVSDLLAAYYPQDGSIADEDELPNQPHVF